MATVTTNGQKPKTAKGSGKWTQNTLKQSQAMQLAASLLGRKNELAAEKPTLTQVAEQMTRELGFQVSESNIHAVIKSGVVEDFRPRVREFRGNKATRVAELVESIQKIDDSTNAMSAAIAALEAKYQALESRVHDLEIGLGVKNLKRAM